MRNARRWLPGAALVLLLVGFALTVLSPDVRGEDGTDHACAAPYDTVLDDARNLPAVGPPPPDAEEIAARCRAVGRTRYRQGIAVMALGGLVGIGAAAAASTRRRRARVGAEGIEPPTTSL